MSSCPSPSDPWNIPTLTGDFTRCDLAHAGNAVISVGFVTCVLVVLLLAVIVFRGR